MYPRVLACGDLHGDWGRINELINKRKPEVILQCGDFGWWPKLEVTKPVLYHQQKPWKLRGIKHEDTAVLWCDGNHEDHESLLEHGQGASYGLVQYMPRGSVATLPDGRIVLFFGGAESVDKDQRIQGVDWFPQETPTYKEFQSILDLPLQPDIIVSHTCPLEFNMVRCDVKMEDPTRQGLSALLHKFKPDLWVFGHWHTHRAGQYLNTKWIALDYPGHGGRWWIDI
jgi:Icc-related predicted phosphoesterase